MSKILSEIRKLQQLKALRSEQAISRVLKKETDLRNEVKEISRLRSQAHEVSESFIPMRSIGSDLMWLAWLDRCQNTVNQNLAKILVQKEDLKRVARKDIGKKSVAESLYEKSSLNDQNLVDKNKLKNLLETSVVLNKGNEI